MTTFQKAIRGSKPLKIAIGGASDTGKTYTSLLLCQELAKLTGKRTGGVDTDNGRMSFLYADKFDFDAVKVSKPFEPTIATRIIHDAEREGLGQLIIDSGSDFYDGVGGLLDMAKARAAAIKNPLAGWGQVTPINNEFFDAIGSSPLHILFTVRSRSGEMMQRKDFNFKFDVVLMLDAVHTATVVKSFGEMIPVGTKIARPNGNLVKQMLGETLVSVSEHAWDEWRKLTARAILNGVPYPENVMRTSVSETKLREMYAKLDAYVRGAEQNAPVGILKSQGRP